MTTERLHYDDPLRLELEAEVVGHGEWEGAPTVVLDRTVFYPESGGQLADRGALGFDARELAVRDAQLGPDGAVHHLLDAAVARPAVGASVRVRVEPSRRRQHMAMHTAQHALSRALLDELGAVTVSSRLGETACTIDVDRDGLDLEAVRVAAARVTSSPPPLLVKIAPDLADEDIDEVARLALRTGLDGIVATNTTISRDGLRSRPSAVSACGAGGLSGAPLKARALDVMKRLRGHVGDRLVLIGAGGIEDADDAWARIRAGASLVQIYTGFIYGGPRAAKRIADGVLERARAAGFARVQDAVGCDVPAPAGPPAIEA